MAARHPVHMYAENAQGDSTGIVRATHQATMARHARAGEHAISVITEAGAGAVLPRGFGRVVARRRGNNPGITTGRIHVGSRGRGHDIYYAQMVPGPDSHVRNTMTVYSTRRLSGVQSFKPASRGRRGVSASRARYLSVDSDGGLRLLALHAVSNHHRSRADVQDVLTQVMRARAIRAGNMDMIAAGDMNHGRAAARGIAATLSAMGTPVQAFRPATPTHQAGGNLDGFMSTAPALGPVATVPGAVRSDHLPTRGRFSVL